MAKTITNLGLMLMALLLILACVTTVAPPPPQGFVETAIAGTAYAAGSQTARAQTLQAAVESVTLTPSRIPSSTPLATFTLVVLGASEIKALVDTPCRKGPGDAYEKVFTLRKGRTADLVGRSADGGYWIVRNPNKPEQLCWLVRAQVQVNRLTGNIPVMTAPPLPTATRTPSRTRRPPDTATLTPGPVTDTPTSTATPAVLFDLIYSGLDDCSFTTWWINFEVGNTGDFDFESLNITITDNDATPTPLTLSLDSEQFIGSNGCGAPDTFDILPIGVSYVISSSPLTYDPTGHNIDASITLCTDVTQSGACVTKTMNVTP